jgi:hypothetical protein
MRRLDDAQDGLRHRAMRIVATLHAHSPHLPTHATLLRKVTRSLRQN